MATDKSVRDMKTTVIIIGNTVEATVYLGRRKLRTLHWQRHKWPMGEVPGLSNPGFARQRFILGKMVEQGFDCCHPNTTRLADSIIKAHATASKQMEKYNG